MIDRLHAIQDVVVSSKQYEMRNIGVNTPELNARVTEQGPNTVERSHSNMSLRDSANQTSGRELDNMYAESGTNIDVLIASG